MPSGIDLVYIVAGLIVCLFGWVLYWVGLRLLGGLLGGTAAVSLAWFLLGHFPVEPQWQIVILALAGVVGVVAGFFLMTQAHYLVFFVTGAMLGLAAGLTIETSYPDWFGLYFDTPLLQLVFYGGMALVFGVLVLALNQVIVMAVTAFAGTLLVMMGVPQRWAVWLFLPLLIGSFLLQLGILSAIGRPRTEPPPNEKEAP